MQCLILAGGLGTRIASVSNGLPKALLQFGNRTFIDIQLEWLARLGTREVILALGSGAEPIQDFIANSPRSSFYPKIAYSLDGANLLGTGGAIKKALPLLEENFLVTYGDSFLFVPMKKLFEQHLNSKSPATLCIQKNQNRGDKSNVRFRGAQPVKYNKAAPTPDMEYIDYGMCALHRDSFSKFTNRSCFDFAEFLYQTSAYDELGAFVIENRFYEVGSLGGIEEFRSFLLENDFDFAEIQKKVFS